MPFLSAQTRKALKVLPQDEWESILSEIANGYELKEICRLRNFDAGAFYNWTQKDPERAEAFWLAKEAVANSLVEECVGIADNEEGDHRRDRLKIMTRLELAGKWNRARYGNKSVVEHTGDTGTLALDAALAGMMMAAVRNQNAAIDAQPSYDIEDAQMVADDDGEDEKP